MDNWNCGLKHLAFGMVQLLLELLLKYDKIYFVIHAQYRGMMPPVSRRSGLILCSIITLLGALLSTFAWRENALIVARIITGIGMGGEYPLASSHSAESSENSGAVLAWRSSAVHFLSSHCLPSDGLYGFQRISGRL